MSASAYRTVEATMDQAAVRAAFAAYSGLQAKGLYGLDRARLEEMGFGEDRYSEEGPDKHEQEDCGITTCGMFRQWAEELSEAMGFELDFQPTRLVAEHLYSVFGFGICANEDAEWEAEFGDGTVSTEVALEAESVCRVLDAVDSALKAAGFDRDAQGWFKDGYGLALSVAKRA